MKTDLFIVLRMTGVFVGIFFALFLALGLGPIPFIVSFILGLLIQRPWLGYAMALSVTVSVTLYSSMQPEVFRFGNTDLMIHNGIFVAGIPSLVVNLPKNIFFSHLGVATGIAFRQGFQTKKKIEQVGDGDAEPAA